MCCHYPRFRCMVCLRVVGSGYWDWDQEQDQPVLCPAGSRRCVYVGFFGLHGEGTFLKVESGMADNEEQREDAVRRGAVMELQKVPGIGCVFDSRIVMQLTSPHPRSLWCVSVNVDASKPKPSQLQDAGTWRTSSPRSNTTQCSRRNSLRA